MARAFAEGLAAGGLRVKLMNMDEVHRSDVVYEILEAGALCAGSPTLNNNLLPQMADVLTYLRGLRPANLVGCAFGSYGWSGESAKQVQEYLEEMKVSIVGEAIRVKHVPDRETLARCYEQGGLVAAAVKERVAAD
jgi:flavorubredoxin